ncbi:hypothetical protein AN478_00450 [Thiohalorhabdus denitrificans]|uniref:3-deoxy-D-manno-octulosonic-acid transferase n=1 Tax=Thiohalorhabdus denitrificans TaxID=381306 RepID=A0A0P9C8I5_9GAMM|nr:hypothetical protein [Thiohalorhabdus denitrificans]KPV41598.1 hypothetical protein AN478_00450 [Thiohalorhabdus denitrificans]SCY57758.1 hypothetical protein SAMN05661077_2581 [Thiohalorhabdus denitrificans]
MRFQAPNPRTPLYWARDLRDRLRRRPEGPLGRWGWFRAPGGTGPLLWVYAPDCDGARVGAEMVRGIRSVRVDVRAVVMAADGCAETLRPLFREYPGTAAAPMVADHQRAARRAASRLQPNGLLAVRRLPPRHVLKGLASAGIPVTAVGCEPPRRLPRGLVVEHVLPVGQAQAERWRATGVEPEAPVDLEVLLARTDVEPTFRSLLVPGEGRRLLWTDALPADPGQREALLDAWGSGGRTLVVTGSGGEEVPGRAAVRLSEWDRERDPVEPGTVVWMDEDRWLPAVSASAFAGCLWQGRRTDLWQALASGLPLVVGPEAAATLRDLGVDPDAGAVVAGDWAAAERQWAHWAEEAFAWRDQQARTRRTFWEARRRAEQAMAILDGWVDRW